MKLSSFSLDLLIHVFSLIVVLVYLWFDDFWQAGSTPPIVYPFFFLIGTVTVFRQHELLEHYRTKLIFLPTIFSILIMGFCLISEMGRDFWAFSSPRQFPVIFRVLWVHVVLLLLHPLMFPLVWQKTSQVYVWLKERGYFREKVIITAVVCGVGLWFLRSQNLSPDGYDWLKHSVIPKSWASYLREPLGTLIFRGTVIAGQKTASMAPYNSLTLLTIICGFLTTLLMRPILKHILPPAFWGIGMVFLISCVGYTQIFAGNIEIYALLHLGLALFLWTAFHYTKGTVSVWVPGLMFGILFCVHLSAAWWFLAFLALPLLKITYNDNTDVVKEVCTMLASFTIFVFGFWLFVLQYGYAGNLTSMWAHFNSDQVMYVGTDKAMFNKLEVYLHSHYYWKMFNEYMFMLPGGLLLLILLLMAKPYWRPLDPMHLWLILLTGGYYVYSIVWHPDRAFPMDWDIFSGLTIPAALLLLSMVCHLSLLDRTKQYILYQISIHSAFFLLWVLLRNHIKISDWPTYL